MSSEEHKHEPENPEPEAREEQISGEEVIEEGSPATEPEARSEPANGEIVEEGSSDGAEEPLSDELESEAEASGAVSDVELAVLAEELEATRRERDEYLDSLRRLKAEFENARKRQEKERERILRTASERLILSLLPVLDNLDRALQSEGDIREGVRATREQLADAMSREGLLPVNSDGERFDPSVHEAVMSQPSEEHEEGTVLQTFERGYLLNGKPIRPARVVVVQQG